jgi:magnesium chelatase family protein
MFVSTYAGAVAGIDAVKVTVEVNLTGGGLGLYLEDEIPHTEMARM